MKEHKIASVQPLAKVKSRIKNTLLQQKTSQKVQTVSEDILARVKNNESIVSIEKRYSEVKWNNNKSITRKADAKSLISDNLRKYVFAMAKPADNKTNWGKVTLTAGNQAVVGLSKVEETAEGQADVERITQTLGNADYNSYVQHVKSKADIFISKAALDAETGTDQ